MFKKQLQASTAANLKLTAEEVKNTLRQTCRQCHVMAFPMLNLNDIPLIILKLFQH